jgi:hypothetical protein
MTEPNVESMAMPVPMQPARAMRPSRFIRLFQSLKHFLVKGSRSVSKKPRGGRVISNSDLRAIGAKRTLAQWKELRRRTTAEVKVFLDEQKPQSAIKKLTHALIEDPQHPAYHELLKKAVELRHQRRVKAGRKDPWADLPAELKQDALQLEAFTAYVEELEQLFDKLGIPPLSAPLPPDQPQKQQSGKSRAAKPQN